MSTRKSLTGRGWTVMILCAVAALGAGPDDPKADARDAKAILRRMADYYKKARSFTVEFNLAQTVGPTTMKTTVAATVERPNKLAIRVKGVLLVGIDFFSDGKTLTISIGAAKRFTESKAPASFSDLSPDEPNQDLLMSKLLGSMLQELTDADPYEALTHGVKTLDHVGQEFIDGGKVEHVRCTRDEFNWEVWVAAEGDPVVRKIVMDMTSSAAKSPAAAQVKRPKVEMISTFKAWKINPPLNDKTFTFDPPAGSQRVDSLEQLFSVDGSEGRDRQQ